MTPRDLKQYGITREAVRKQMSGAAQRVRRACVGNVATWSAERLELQPTGLQGLRDGRMTLPAHQRAMMLAFLYTWTEE